MSALLELEDVTRRFGGLNAVEGVSFSVAQGEIVGLIGPNGAGKTTLIDVITGVHPASSGRVRRTSHTGGRIRSRGLVSRAPSRSCSRSPR